MLCDEFHDHPSHHVPDNVQPSGNEQAADEEGVSRPKSLLRSYCAIDFPRMHDVVQLKLHRLRKRIRDQVKDTYVGYIQVWHRV